MSLQEIKESALRLKNLRDKKDSLTQQLKDVNNDIKSIEEYELSGSLEDLGISDVTIDNVHIKKGVIFRGGVTSHTDREAFQYLFDSNNEGALKQKIVVDLARYPGVGELLSKSGIGYETQYTIHHMTLSSILKELVADGKISTEDFDKYSIYAQPQIKVEMK